MSTNEPKLKQKRRPRRNHAATDRHARGERSGTSKLTEVQVLAIRSDARSLKEIAADYGIHLQYVSHLRRGKSWRYLNV